MKKLISLLSVLLLIFLLGCNPITTDVSTDNFTTSTPTTLITTTETITTDFTTIVNDEIYLVLHAGVDTVEINSEWIDAGAKIYINDIEYIMTTTDVVDINELGVFTINYYYTYQEVEYKVLRYVIVTDQTKPVLTLNMGIDTVKVESEWVDAGVTVTDNSNETLEVQVFGHVDIFQTGTYVITYRAIDSSGNVGTITRFVTVIE